MHGSDLTASVISSKLFTACQRANIIAEQACGKKMTTIDAHVVTMCHPVRYLGQHIQRLNSKKAGTYHQCLETQSDRGWTFGAAVRAGPQLAVEACSNVFRCVKESYLQRRLLCQIVLNGCKHCVL